MFTWRKKHQNMHGSYIVDMYVALKAPKSKCLHTIVIGYFNALLFMINAIHDR